MRGSGGPGQPEGVLVCAPSWLGDSVIAMPALQAFRRTCRGARITLLAKPSVRAIWELHPAPDMVVTLETGVAGSLRTVRRLRRLSLDRAYVLPHSLRSVIIPWLAGVRVRIGRPGHFPRDRLLTRVVGERGPRWHQAHDYLELLVGTPDTGLDEPRLVIPEDLRGRAARTLAAVPRPRVALFPGAARGPSKRWPVDHFVALGRRALQGLAGGIVVLGSRGERQLCRAVAGGIGEGALNLGGRTDLRELVGTLTCIDAVVANDSGGMHLSAAVGTPVVAIFGRTDPDRTGPLGRCHRVLQAAVERSSSIGRTDPRAREALAAVTPEDVYTALRELMKQGSTPGSG